MPEESFFKRLWRIVYPFLTYIGVTLIIGFLAMFVIIGKLMAAGGMDITDEAALEALILAATEQYMTLAVPITALAAAVSIPILCLYRHLDTRYEYKTGTHVTYEKPEIWSLLICALLGFFAGSAGNGLITFSGLDTLVTTEAEQMMNVYSDSIAFDLLADVIIIPICEEMVFRWLIYRRVRRNAPFALSVILTSLLFAFYHGNLVQGIYAFLLGTLFAIVLEKTQSIAGAVLAHGGANLFSVLGSDLGALDGVYTKTAALLIVTAVSMIITMLLLNVIFTRCAAKVLIPAAGPSPEQHETPAQ